MEVILFLGIVFRIAYRQGNVRFDEMFDGTMFVRVNELFSLLKI
jgi:hypothetical protein